MFSDQRPILHTYALPFGRIPAIRSASIAFDTFRNELLIAALHFSKQRHLRGLALGGALATHDLRAESRCFDTVHRERAKLGIEIDADVAPPHAVRSDTG